MNAPIIDEHHDIKDTLPAHQEVEIEIEKKRRRNIIKREVHLLQAPLVVARVEAKIERKIVNTRISDLFHLLGKN